MLSTENRKDITFCNADFPSTVMPILTLLSLSTWEWFSFVVNLRSDVKSFFQCLNHVLFFLKVPLICIFNVKLCNVSYCHNIVIWLSFLATSMHFSMKYHTPNLNCVCQFFFSSSYNFKNLVTLDKQYTFLFIL